MDPVVAATIDVSNVDFVRDKRYLLHDVTLTVLPGEHWVLIGPNGAGKTTLLKLLGAHAHPTHGTVRVLGHQLGKVDMRELRRSIGHVDPRHPLEWPLSVHQVVLTGATNTIALQQRWTPTPAQIQQADDLIGVLGMNALREARWQTLSSGERGRALIARALMPEPSLLLLDEPATGLDLAAREQLLSGLDGLGSQFPALASVLVTHHLEEIPASTTHAVLLREGEVVAQGAAREVITSEHISKTFDHPVQITHDDGLTGRWAARALPGTPYVRPG